MGFSDTICNFFFTTEKNLVFLFNKVVTDVNFRVYYVLELIFLSKLIFFKDTKAFKFSN